ncbi:hypothetical protein HYH03_009246 [Edaphochlamys debaryana]|uniref:phytol kinase n=1 Tax=Edaphochlamys debaryana TaxID=47281 RepID=A0A835XZ10_9CHLO|nr:hypothetical protein HYH03_009246 [Edaphochlamys debaryana]|eukprot:KAG2492585.1 hypothetical protein HYH03_009246 [Edaphochlamys debaryana]
MGTSLVSDDLCSQPGVEAGRLQLARGLLRTQALQATARQLAAFADGMGRSGGPPVLAVAACHAEAMRLVTGLIEVSKPDFLGDVLAAMGHLRGSCPPEDQALVAEAGLNLVIAYDLFDSLPSEARVLQVLSGPCARHAVMVAGLAALGELEGAAEAPGSGDKAYAKLSVRLCALIAALDPSLPAHPHRFTATRLLLRVGFAAAQSGGQPGGAPAGAAGAAGAAGSSGTGSGSGSGSGRLALSLGVIRTGIRALYRATRHLEAHVPWRGRWLGAAADSWRLIAALLGPAAALDVENTSRTQALMYPARSLLGSCVADADRTCFPAEAPPPTAAALAGGALPILERQMRRAGEVLEGPEAKFMAGLEDALDGGSTLHLLAYGEPLQAAAYAATITKLLRRAAAGGLPCSGDKGYSPLRPCHDVCYGIYSAVSPDGAAPAALSRLGLVLSLALPEWLPELSRLALQGAAEDEAAWREEQEQRQGAGEQRGTDGEAADDNHRLLFLTRSALMGTPLALGFQLATSSVPAAAEGSAAAGGAEGPPGSSTDGACRGGGGPDGSDGEVVWRLAGLPEVELVGAALGLLHRRRPDPCDALGTALYGATGEFALRLASMRPSDVRALAADGSASASASAWRPEAVRSVAEAMRRAADDYRSEDSADATKAAHALATLARHLEPLAVQLQAWAAGEEGDGSVTWVDVWAEVPAEWKANALLSALAPFLVPAAEARRRLGLPPACSNPACANLAGDSEAGLRRQRCGRCGQASYCCRDCQTAHWRSGHKEACGGGSGGGSKAG